MTHFSSLIVSHYRGLRGLTIEDPGCINLIAGHSNAGKTSVLEAIYLLAQQNHALLEIIQRRAYSQFRPDAQQIAALLPAETSIQGIFQGQPAQIRWHPRSECDELLHVQGSSHVLCPAELLTSPFMQTQTGLIQAYETSSQRGVLARVLAFFKEAMGVDLESIERDELRFVVREKHHQKGRDLGTYGMGMQRVFHIALRFASVAGGVLLLDDFETSLHAGVYAPLVGLLCDLAREFHVQVFLSTHSAEVVHAWTTPSLRSAVVGYGLRRVPGQETSEAVRFGGEKLHALHEAFGFDLRGVC